MTARSVCGILALLASGAGLAAATPSSGAAPGAAATGSVAGRRWAWPLDPLPAITRPFRAPATAYGPGHRGADLTPRSPGAAVHAVADGVVTHVGMLAGRGTVTVTHPDGLRSTYEPVRGTVRVGQSVARGSMLGMLTGPSHCDPRPTCLHLGAVRRRGYVDPLQLIRGGPVVLLPLG